jgi:chromosomal replication initiation ATPase DnaA
VQNCIEGNIYVTAKSEIWHQALKELGRSLNNRTFEKWIKPIRVREVTGDAISLQVPNKSFSNRLEKFFLGRISKALSLVAQRDLKVSLVTDKTNCESFPQSYGDIAKKYHVDRWTVEDKIEAFVRKLPNPVLLHSHAQRMVAAIVEGLKARDRVVAAMSAETGQ